MTVFVFVKKVVCCLRSSASDGAVLASLFHLPCLLCLAVARIAWCVCLLVVSMMCINYDVLYMIVYM